jgi:glutamate racemase
VLLLGCTHYPFLARTIGDVMGRGVVLVSSAEETAFDVRAILESTGMGRRTAGKADHRFLSTGDVGWFAEMGRRLLGPELVHVEPVEPVALDAARCDLTRPGAGPGRPSEEPRWTR